MLDRRRLQFFHMYPNQREILFNIADVKKFLQEEGLLIQGSHLEQLDFSFALGLKEGSQRILRCLYDRNSNNSLFLALGTNIETVNWFREMRPYGYHINFIETDDIGKFNLQDLEHKLKNTCSCKTLYLEIITDSGGIIEENELISIIELCKKFNVFVIFDISKINTQFQKSSNHVDVSQLCYQTSFTDFAIIFSAAPMFGHNLKGIGFILLNKISKILTVSVLESEIISTFGTLSDLPFELARVLLTMEVTKKSIFKQTRLNDLRYNMNLVLAYIEGINSAQIDPDLLPAIKTDLLTEHSQGIKNLRVIYKPIAGNTIKIGFVKDNSSLGVRTLLLSFSCRDRIHIEMKALLQCLHELNIFSQNTSIYQTSADKKKEPTPLGAKL